MPAGCFIDSSLLALFVVGFTDHGLISKHRRLREFTAEDYHLLTDLIGRVGPVLITPNTLTETSNLLAYHGEPERSRFFNSFRFLIENNKEIVVASLEASRNASFKRLGLTEAALLEVVTAETPLVTVDFDLYWQASSNDPGSAVNFTDLRDLP